MCGLTGFWRIAADQNEQALKAQIAQMTDSLHHRGPDSGDVWVDPADGIALGHRRLAIVDLSPEGAQPMISRSGRYVCVFNGEFYNYLEPRHELEKAGHFFRGHSDTETMLALFDQGGLDAVLKTLKGMYAFAVWDREERCLYLARDPMGKKPLYYGMVGHSLVFGSELKSLKRYDGFDSSVNRDALGLFMKHNYVPAPHTIYERIYKLEAGTYLKLSQNDLQENRATPDQAVRFWDMAQIAQNGVQAKKSAESEADILDALDALLTQSTQRRMISDVPLGAFLSGGIDSSLVVALMQKLSDRPVRTFSIGFEEFGFDESPHAKAIAAHLGTDHTELYVTPKECLETVPHLPHIYDEPFADPSMIPTYHVCRLARQHVTVALSGDGGDEFFGGYSRYQTAQNIWQKLKALPHFVKQTGAWAAQIGASPQMQSIASPVANLLPPRASQMLSDLWLKRVAGTLGAGDYNALYDLLMTYWPDPAHVVKGYQNQPSPMHRAFDAQGSFDPVQRSMLADAVAYLPEDILVKVDRASMASSLEARAPLLDVDVISYAWTLPVQMGYRGGVGKYALKQVLNRYLPEHLYNRPKQGFGIPLAEWLRGPLKDWAEDLLSENRLQQDGYFHAKPIRDKWAAHLKGKQDWSYHLWSVLMFQAWKGADFDA